MKKLILLSIIGLALQAHAQVVVEKSPQVISQQAKEDFYNGLMNREEDWTTAQNSLKCAGVDFGNTTLKVNPYNTSIHYHIEVLNRKTKINEFNIDTLSSVWTPISNTQTHTYIASVKSVKNPSQDPQEVAKKPYVLEYTPGQIMTGINLILSSNVEKNNNINTTLCFNKSELVSLNKLSYKDENIKDEDMTIELPNTRLYSGLQQFVLPSGNDITISLNSDISVKIKAAINKI